MYINILIYTHYNFFALHFCSIFNIIILFLSDCVELKCSVEIYTYQLLYIYNVENKAEYFVLVFFLYFFNQCQMSFIKKIFLIINNNTTKKAFDQIIYLNEKEDKTRKISFTTNKKFNKTLIKHHFKVNNKDKRFIRGS